MKLFNLNRVFVLAILTCFAVMLAGTGLFAQTGELSGQVFDPQGAVVPGSEVVIVNQATGAERMAVTDDEGRYRFLQVIPGLYTLRAELVGFKTTEVTDFRVVVDVPLVRNLIMELGEITEVVTVASTSEKLMNETDASMGNAFVEEQITALPLNRRNVYRLLSLQPGVTEDGEVSGSRSDQSNLTLDGIDVNEQQTGAAFNTVLRVNPESIQEFRVTVSNPNASQGRSSGGQVSLVTKSGTNDWHGSAYEFHRNTNTTANDFFNNRVTGDPDNDGKQGIARPKLIRNVFGGSIGGPIVKDKAFFFFNYEGRTDRSESSTLHTTPLPNLGLGEMRYVNDQGQTIQLTQDEFNAIYGAGNSEVGINQAAVSVMAEAAAKYPNNDSGVGDSMNIGGYRFNGSTPIDWNSYIARMDFNLTDNQQLYLRGNYQWDHAGNISYWPDTPAPTTWSHPFGAAVGHTWMIRPTLINTFRYGITRQAFSDQGDSSDPGIWFRFVFSPRNFSRTLSRTTPLHNFTNDMSWIKGNHTFQFGTNIRLIENQRQSFANSFDNAIMNPSFYAASGGVLDIIPDAGGGQRDIILNAATTLIGRYTQYTWNFNFNADGSLMGPGLPVDRIFATDEYEFYFEDTWQMTPNFTLNLGIRWGINTPVWETSGFQVKPTLPLDEFFNRRVAGALRGIPYNDPIILDKAGPFYGTKGFYPTDYNNFSPRVSFAYSPSFDDGILKTIFGEKDQSVIRGGFSMMYDRIGSALAVSFDLNNTLGFSSGTTIAANTYDITFNPGPLFTGFNQDVRSLPNIDEPDALVFPVQKPSDGAQRIESSLDEALTTPVNYNWNISLGRELGNGLYIEASYLGRIAKDLMATRDVAHLNNITDPVSGQDWYTAARVLQDNRLASTPIDQINDIPFFENLFPDVPSDWWWATDPNLTATQNIYAFIARGEAGGIDILDYTFLQAELDDAGIYPDMFFHPQYAALSAFSTVASSNYHAFTTTVRQRFTDLTMDLNWTWAKSIDNASGLQTAGTYGSAFILNPLALDDNRAVSDFDTQHIINANWIWAMPFGRGKTYLADAPGVVDAILGGWSLNGVFRWNTGLPVSSPFEGSRWATNWNVQSNGTRTRDPNATPCKNCGVDGHPNFFQDPTYAYRSYRDAYAGETGDRNVERRSGFFTIDFGLNKSFRMPYAEGHEISFRWEVFNATNTQFLGFPRGGRTGYGFDPDPHLGTPTADFGNITAIQGIPRVMQFGLRYSF